jgi:hypothetical protein
MLTLTARRTGGGVLVGDGLGVGARLDDGVVDGEGDGYAGVDGSTDATATDTPDALVAGLDDAVVIEPSVAQVAEATIRALATSAVNETVRRSPRACRRTNADNLEER